MKVLLLFYLLLAVPLVVAMLTWSRRSRAGQDVRAASDARELEASRDLIDRLLTTAIDHRDVDTVLAPIVIDEIRTHQRHLHRRDDGRS